MSKKEHASEYNFVCLFRWLYTLSTVYKKLLLKEMLIWFSVDVCGKINCTEKIIRKHSLYTVALAITPIIFFFHFRIFYSSSSLGMWSVRHKAITFLEHTLHIFTYYNTAIIKSICRRLRFYFVLGTKPLNPFKFEME